MDEWMCPSGGLCPPPPTHLVNRECLFVLPHEGYYMIPAFTPNVMKIQPVTKTECTDDIVYVTFRSGMMIRNETVPVWEDSTCYLISPLQNVLFEEYPLVDLVIHTSKANLTVERIPSASFGVEEMIPVMTAVDNPPSQLIHTITFPSYPSFTCCGPGYFLQVPEYSSACGLPANQVVFKKLYTEEPFNIPHIPCVTDGGRYTFPTEVGGVDEASSVVFAVTDIIIEPMTIVPYLTGFGMFAFIMLGFGMMYVELKWRKYKPE